MLLILADVFSDVEVDEDQELVNDRADESKDGEYNDDDLMTDLLKCSSRHWTEEDSKDIYSPLEDPDVELSIE